MMTWIERHEDYVHVRLFKQKKEKERIILEFSYLL